MLRSISIDIGNGSDKARRSILFVFHSFKEEANPLFIGGTWACSPSSCLHSQLVSQRIDNDAGIVSDCWHIALFKIKECFVQGILLKSVAILFGLFVDI